MLHQSSRNELLIGTEGLELLKNNVVNFSKDEDITDNLVIEYIIIKLMEEIKNGYANDKR